MQITPEGKLELFESFEADPELPKSKERAQREAERQRADLVIGEPQGTPALNTPVFRGAVVRRNPMTMVFPRRWMSPWDRAWLWIEEKFAMATRRQLTVQEVFSSLKDSAEQIEIVNERAEGFAAMLQQAQANGQVALAEKILGGIDAYRSETQLLALGLTKFIREETIVELSKKSPRAIRLDWVQNFTRPIPPAVSETKRECDERRIFDNYAVLHYDPKNTSRELTKREKEAKRDPILFGVLEGSRRLYFVGDWIDEQCDLTLEKIAELLGGGAVGQLEARG